jgi:hypothetical protein
MAPPKLEIPPALRAEGQRLYEQTLTPLHEIAAMMGICRATLRNRIREWGWVRRRQPSRALDLLHAVRGAAAAGAGEGAEAAAAPAAAPQAPPAPVTAERQAALVARIVGVIEREMDAIERVLVTVKPADQAEGERSTRVLAGIAQTLRETATLIRSEPTPPPHDADSDPAPRDMDAFREELARRIHALIDAEQARAEAGGDAARRHPEH